MSCRPTAGVVVAATALALAGCGNFASSTDAKPSTSATVDPGEKFINSVIDASLKSYAVKGIPAASQLKAFPPKWCKALDAGHSVDWMLGDGNLYPIGENWGTEKSDAYQLVVLGVEAYCPKRAAEVKKELRDSGVY